MTEVIRDSALPPTVVAAAQGLLGRLEELTVSMADAILAQESVYRELATVPREDLERSCEDHLSWVLGEMTGRHRDTRTAVEVGRRRAEQRVPLQALLHAYRVGARYMATLMIEETSGIVRGENLLPTVNIAWEMLEEYTESVTTAYLEAVNDRTRRDAEARSAVTAALLDGNLRDAPAVLDAARTLGLPAQATYVVAAIVTTATDQRSADDRLRGAGVVSAWHHELETHRGLIALPAKGKADALFRMLAARHQERVGISTPFTDLAFAPSAASQARLAVETAAEGATVHYDEAPLPVLLVSAPDAADHLVQCVLGPVLELPERERLMLLETLEAWFENEGSAAKTASAMFIHRNTVGYRAQRIETLTGRRLADSRDAAELFVALEAHRLRARD